MTANSAMHNKSHFRQQALKASPWLLLCLDFDKKELFWQGEMVKPTSSFACGWAADASLGWPPSILCPCAVSAPNFYMKVMERLGRIWERMQSWLQSQGQSPRLSGETAAGPCPQGWALRCLIPSRPLLKGILKPWPGVPKPSCPTLTHQTAWQKT